MKKKTNSPTRSKSAHHNGRAARDLKAALLAECARLTALMDYNETEGFHFWPEMPGLQFAEECGICTNGAKLIARNFGGYVAGYPISPDEPQNLVGAVAFGHDFAVVGDFIVDWWAWEYERSIRMPVISRAYGVKCGKYKDEYDWKVFPQNDFRKPPLGELAHAERI